MVELDKDIDEMTKADIMECLDDLEIAYETDANKPVLKELLENYINAEPVVEIEVEEASENGEVPSNGALTVKGRFTTQFGVIDSSTPQKTLQYLLNKYPELSKYIG